MTSPPQTTGAITPAQNAAAAARLRARRRAFLWVAAGAALGATCPWWPEQWQAMCRAAGSLAGLLGKFLGVF